MKLSVIWADNKKAVVTVTGAADESCRHHTDREDPTTAAIGEQTLGQRTV